MRTVLNYETFAQFVKATVLYNLVWHIQGTKRHSIMGIILDCVYQPDWLKCERVMCNNPHYSDFCASGNAGSIKHTLCHAVTYDWFHHLTWQNLSAPSCHQTTGQLWMFSSLSGSEKRNVVCRREMKCEKIKWKRLLIFVMHPGCVGGELVDVLVDGCETWTSGCGHSMELNQMCHSFYSLGQGRNSLAAVAC